MDELTNQSEGMAQETQDTQFTQEMTQENTTQQVETTLEPQSIRVKYNHQELDLPYDEAVTHIQKGMNYEKAVERARQEAIDQEYAAMGYTWNGKPITSKAEYQEALREQELMQKYQNQGLPEDVVSELIENRKFREQYQTQQQQIEAQQRKAQEEADLNSRRDGMYDEFLGEFPDYNTEEKWAAIPKDVWADAEKWLKTGGREGRRLADAMTRHNWRQNQAQQQASEANQANAMASTGSVKAAAPPKGPLTEEMVEAMTDKERMARWPEIRKLYNMK